MGDELKTVRRACRLYEAMLLLYPRNHRRDFGALMTQLFRDQCRDACRNDARWPVLRLWLRTLRDLIATALSEHVTEQTNRIKNMRPNKLALILFIVALVASLLTSACAPGHLEVAAGLAYVSSVALLFRAIVDWTRPVDQLIRSLVWGAAIAVLWAWFLPMWAKLKLPIIAPLVAVPILLNGVLPIVKTVVQVLTRRTPRPPQ